MCLTLNVFKKRNLLTTKYTDRGIAILFYLYDDRAYDSIRMFTYFHVSNAALCIWLLASYIYSYVSGPCMVALYLFCS